MKKKLTFCLSTLVLLSGCASIIEGSTTRVNVLTQDNKPASCNLKNERGAWSALTPGSATIKRSKTDLNISCTDQATGAKGSKVVESDTETWIFGNLLFGGIIGGIVDFSTGSAWDYPKDITVPMQTPTSPAAQTPGAAPQAMPFGSGTPVTGTLAAPTASPAASAPAAPASGNYNR